MYESDEEEEEGVNLDVVRRQEQPREEIRVYMDPPIERADGDTDKDSGEKKNKVEKNFKKYYSVADPDLIFYPSRIPDPKKAPDSGSWIRNNVSDNFLEKKLKKTFIFLTIFFLLQMTLTSQLA